MVLSTHVAIVILNWNGKVFLEQFLPSVIKYSNGATIYVADNLSTDESNLFLEAHYPQVQIIKNEDNFGFAQGYNIALKQIEADYYILLNSDVEVTENWIDPIIYLMEQDKTIAACQPKILDYKKPSDFEYAGAAGGFIDKYGYPFCRGRLFNTIELDHHQYDDAIEVFWATGACMFVRANAFWEVDGFDNDYFAHMEEIDLCWRMKNIGYKVYVEPKSYVYHVGGGTLNKINPKKTYLNFRNNLITLIKNANSSNLFFKLIYRMLLDGIAAYKFLLEGNGLHFIAVAKAHFAFYAMLPATLHKRKVMLQKKGFAFTKSAILPENIVFQYFLSGIKQFSQFDYFKK